MKSSDGSSKYKGLGTEMLYVILKAVPRIVLLHSESVFNLFLRLKGPTNRYRSIEHTHTLLKTLNHSWGSPLDSFYDSVRH